MKRQLLRLIISLLFIPLPFTLALAGNEPQTVIRQLVVQSSINPATAAFIVEQIEIANEQQDLAILLQLDTPGGLDSAMRMIIQAELQSQRPVIVYVAPAGARAASAGALITIAADFAVMAPGTNIGAAHPVSIGGGDQLSETMKEKVSNDAVAYIKSLAQKRGRNVDWAEKAVRESASIPAQEALKIGVIDLVAENSAALLKGLNGKSYQRNGKSVIFTTTQAILKTVEMNWRQKILDTISNPTVAYMLLMLGMLGIFFEISQPGVILPGVVGSIALLLAFFALQALPVNYVGILLILLALVLFILEVKIMSYGMLTVGGITAMSIGSLMLIDSTEPYMQISKAVIAASVLTCSSFFLFATWMVFRNQQRPVVSGLEGMIGEIGQAVTSIKGTGKIFVHGEYWQAESDEPVKKGNKVEVIGIGDHMHLLVKPYKIPES
jgi:membrane-bound serine protease (ClpP class)